MPFGKEPTITGWGVVRETPWHLVGIFETEEEALVALAECGDDYEVGYGEGRAGSDDFIWHRKLS